MNTNFCPSIEVPVSTPIRRSTKHAFGRFARIAGAIALSVAAAPALALKNDYPTTDRVVYVQECMNQHPGHHYEMVNKCSCALDKIAAEVPFKEFETMVTATNANSIGGERGNAIRDVESMQTQIKRFRALQTTAKKSCFINDAK